MNADVLESKAVTLATRDDSSGEWSHETRDTAYLLWAWELHQSTGAVAERLDVPDRTVRYWARTDGWRLRFERERADLDPIEARPAIALRLQGGAMSAAAYLEAVAAGIVQPDKGRIAASKILLDSAGFAGLRVTGAEHEHAERQSAVTRTDYASLSPADLALHERRLRLSSRTPDSP